MKNLFVFLIWLSFVSFPEVQHTYLPAVPESESYHQNYQIHASVFLILHTGIVARNLGQDKIKNYFLFSNFCKSLKT